MLDVILGETKPAVTFLFVAVGLLLAAATASVASMQLARATARRREMAVRLAIGAGRRRLVQQWLIESVILGTTGGVLGMALAFGLHVTARSMLAGAFPRVDDVRLDSTVWLFAAAMTLVVSVVCGLVPAILVVRQPLTGSLFAGRADTASLFDRIRVGHVRMLILGGQVAVACVLLVAAGVLTRSFTTLATTDRGYDAENVLTARLNFQHSVTPLRRIEMLESIQQQLGVQPGVLRVGFGNGLPLVHVGNVFSQSIPSPHDPATSIAVSATWRVVAPEYLEALRLRVVAGRLLTAADTASTQAVMVVNRSFAAAYLGKDALGTRLAMRVGSKVDWKVVGVVEDVRQGDLSSPERPAFFVAHRQAPDNIAFDPVLVVRTCTAPSNFASRVTDMARQADGSLVADSVISLQDRLNASLARPRTYSWFALSVAGLALGLSGVGLFGVLAYVTSQRSHELGIRIALGARSMDLLSAVMRPVMLAVGSGAVCGGLVSFVLLRMLASILYGVTAHDLVSYAFASVAVLITTMLAGLLPARRVIATDPTTALRS
jgi:predicted permease